MNNKDLSMLSYARILKDIQNFRKAGTNSSNDDFNILDTPGQKYFKILFHFGSKNEFAEKSESPCGLLAPTWDEPFAKSIDLYGRSINSGGDLSDIYINNSIYNISYDNYQRLIQAGSAWSYLVINDELERADKLKNFVELLSNINSKSPWYFSAISGLGEAIERKFVEDPKNDMSTPRKLTLTCMPDSFDDRIATLLNLYRDITWSWVQKREVIPANLRKFDMSIFIFEAPEANWHISEESIWEKNASRFKSTVNELLGTDVIDETKDRPVIGNESLEEKSSIKYVNPSYKLLEFHNCEFNYNSLKTGLNEINNQVGIIPTYTIEISYDDCYEVAYNNLLMKQIGDVIATDTAHMIDLGYGILCFDIDTISFPQLYYENPDQINRVLNPYKSKFLKKYWDQTVNAVSDIADDMLKRAVMGNVNTFSLTQIRDQAHEFVNGNLLGGLRTVADYHRTAESRWNRMTDAYKEDLEKVQRARDAHEKDKDYFKNNPDKIPAIGNFIASVYRGVGEETKGQTNISYGSDDENNKINKIYSPTNSDTFVNGYIVKDNEDRDEIAPPKPWTEMPDWRIEMTPEAWYELTHPDGQPTKNDLAEITKRKAK